MDGNALGHRPDASAAPQVGGLHDGTVEAAAWGFSESAGIGETTAQATQTQNICLRNWCWVMPRLEVGNRDDTWRLPENTGNVGDDRFGFGQVIEV